MAKTHYAHRIDRSVYHLGQSIWQPICGITDVHDIRLSTHLPEVSCLSCRNLLLRHKRRLGIASRLNEMLRDKVWEIE